MNNTANLLRLGLILLIALILQIVVLDNLDFLGPCNPFVYIVFIMAAPFGCSSVSLMFMGAVAGLIVDLVSNTPGMHMAACILIAFVRQYILNILAFRSAYKADDMPSASSCGSLWYFKYTAIMVSIHHVALFLIEQFDSFYLVPTLLRIVLSIIASSLLIILFDMIMPRSTASAID